MQTVSALCNLSVIFLIIYFNYFFPHFLCVCSNPSELLNVTFHLGTGGAS